MGQGMRERGKGDDVGGGGGRNEGTWRGLGEREDTVAHCY